MEQILKQILQNQEETNARLERLEVKLDTFQSQFNEHEVKDANRHIEILSLLGDLKTDLTTLEDISGKNLRDIAILKKAK